MKKPILSSLFPVALLAMSLITHPAAADESFTFNLGGVTIPDGNPTGYANVQNPGSGINVITGLTVNLNITGDPLGGFNGDLYAYLRHVTPGGTGFTVLLNRVGSTDATTDFGYGDSGFNVIFSDIAMNGDIHFYQTVDHARPHESRSAACGSRTRGTSTRMWSRARLLARHSSVPSTA